MMKQILVQNVSRMLGKKPQPSSSFVTVGSVGGYGKTLRIERTLEDCAGNFVTIQPIERSCMKVNFRDYLTHEVDFNPFIQGQINNIQKL